MDQETKKVISKDFQDVLLDTSTVVVSSVFDQEDKIVGGENAKGVDIIDSTLDIDQRAIDKWIPYLREYTENDQLNTVITELENSIDDNFQGLELQLLQDSQLNDKLETSMDEIAEIQSMVELSLSRDIDEFQKNLTSSTNELIRQKQTYLNSKKTSLKISEAIILINKVLRLLELSNKCQELITEGNFFKALQNLDSLEKLYLQEFRDYNFKLLKEIYVSIPYLKSVTKDECINLIKNSLNSNLGKNLNVVGQTFYLIYKDELLSKWLNTREIMKLKRVKFNSPIEISMRDEENLRKLELEQFFNLDAFHDSLMIFETLNETDYLVEEFNKEYEFKKSKTIQPLPWKTSGNTVSVNSTAHDEFKESLSVPFLKEYLLNILGFLLYDINLNRLTDYIFVNNNYNATNEFWEMLMMRLKPYFKYFMDTVLKTEKDIIEFKDFLGIYVCIMENYKLNIDPLYSVMLALFEKYCKTTLELFDKDFQVMLSDDDFMPLTIDNKGFYEKVIKICWMKENRQIIDDMDDENFSVTLPFSPLYPMTCTMTQKVYAKLTSFISSFYRHSLHSLNNILVNTIDGILDGVVNKQIRAKLETTSREEIAQLLINLDYFVIASKEFSNLMTKDNILENPDVEIRLASTKNFAESRKYAESKLIDLIDTKIKDILETVSFDWLDTDRRIDPDISIVDLAQFLEMMFATTLVNLPYSVQILLIFREFDSLTRHFLDVLLHDTPQYISKESVGNFEVDMMYLEGIIPKIFPRTDENENGRLGSQTPKTPTIDDESRSQSNSQIDNNIKSLESTFMELKQCIQLLQSEDPNEYLDPQMRSRKYSRIKPDDANILIGKIRPITAPTPTNEAENSSVFNLDWNGSDSNNGNNRLAKFFNRR